MKAWVLRSEGGGAPLRVYLDQERAVEDFEIVLEANRGNASGGPWKLDELTITGPLVVAPNVEHLDPSDPEYCETCGGKAKPEFHNPRDIAAAQALRK